MKNKSFFPTVVFFIILGIGLAVTYAIKVVSTPAENTIAAAIVLIIASIFSSAVKIANPWEKAVVLRLGKFQSLRGPGLFFIIPVIDTIPFWIDTRVIS